MIRILVDSGASLPKKLIEDGEVTVASLFIRFDGEEHTEADLDVDAFYETIGDRVNDIPTSSQPSQLFFEEFFEEAAAAGDEVLGIFNSSRLSGTFEGAIRAARTVKSHNIDFRCVLVDSTTNSGDEAFPIMDAVDARDSGATLEECAAAATNAVMCSRIIFTPETLAFLKAGGRIGRVAALLGTAIKILPIITVRDGQPVVAAKVRTMKKSIDEMVRMFAKDVKERGLKRVLVQYIGPKTQLLYQLRDEVERVVGHAVDIEPVTPVIAVHVGPAIGISYECMNYLEGKLVDMKPSELVFTA